MSFKEYRFPCLPKWFPGNLHELKVSDEAARAHPFADDFFGHHIIVLSNDQVETRTHIPEMPGARLADPSGTEFWDTNILTKKEINSYGPEKFVIWEEK